MAELFGFEIKRKKSAEVESVVTPTSDDGSTVISTGAAYYGMVMDMDGVVKNEADLIRRYREISQFPECDSAIEDIVNEAIVSEDDRSSVDVVLDDLKQSESIKKKIREEFDNVLKLLDFDYKGHDIFRNWYVDGRLYFHIMLDEKKIKDGIKELRFIDPRKIRKVRNVIKERNAQGVDIVKSIEEFYMFNDKGINEGTTNGVKLSLDSVVYTPSGLMDMNTGMMLGYLHKAIKPVNQLKMIEDSLVIYRVSRAPERRIFYIDVGTLPKIKAEQYVRDIMAKYRNKIVYDATTGEIKDDRKHLSTMEDFWMPRREGGKGTEITTLPGGQNLGEIQDIEYFKNKLYQSLNVPLSRLRQDSGFNLGRASEITRDEVKFSKFIGRVRRKFAGLFADLLRVQLITKGIIRADEWEILWQDIRFDFLKDNHFTELKEADLLTQRLQMLQQIEPYVGRFYSAEYVRKNILRQADEDIEEIDKQIEQEKSMMEPEQQQDDTGEENGIDSQPN
jgi:hypothetical protein